MLQGHFMGHPMGHFPGKMRRLENSEKYETQQNFKYSVLKLAKLENW